MNPAERPWPQEPTAAPAYPPTPAAPYPPIPGPAPMAALHKKPLLAALLSFFPGLGQIYDGLYLRGLVLFLIFGSLITLLAAEVAIPLFAIGVGFTVCFSVLDAYRQAVLINYGYARDLGLSDLPLKLRASQGGIVAGVILCVIGVISLIDRFFVVDLTWLADLWPLGLIAVGVWLIVATLRERRKERESTTGA